VHLSADPPELADLFVGQLQPNTRYRAEDDSPLVDLHDTTVEARAVPQLELLDDIVRRDLHGDRRFLCKIPGEHAGPGGP
jgi:hypothetical protein